MVTRVDTLVLGLAVLAACGGAAADPEVGGDTTAGTTTTGAASRETTGDDDPAGSSSTAAVDATSSGEASTGDVPDGPCMGIELEDDACEILRAMRWTPELPPAHGNAVADDETAAELGFALFFDARLSSNNQVRCATCHEPDFGFGDGKPVSMGVGTVARNAPSALDVAHVRWQFWDGRADSLWSQALAPIEHPDEMASTRLAVAHRIFDDYAERYEAVFGPLPPLGDLGRFPATGAPGWVAYDGMDPADRHAVDEVFVNVGKSLEAYMRRLVTGPAPFDRFLDGEPDAISPAAMRGAAVFFAAGCPSCHAGPQLADGAFHNLGMPDDDDASAQGRALGIERLLAAEFNAASEWFDGEPPTDFPPTVGAADLGAFRTPTLRNLAVTGPYGHTGAYANLSAIVQFHLDGGGEPIVGERDALLQPHELELDAQDDLLAFLGSLRGGEPPLPWGEWPM